MHLSSPIVIQGLDMRFLLDVAIGLVHFLIADVSRSTSRSVAVLASLQSKTGWRFSPFISKSRCW